MTAGSSLDDPAAQSHLAGSAGCAPALDEPQAGCLVATSGDHGTAADTLQAGTDSAGSAAAAPADTTPDRPQAPRTVREFEHALQGLGFTRRQAASIARDGFKATAQDAEPDHDRAAFNRHASSMQSLLAAMKG